MTFVLRKFSKIKHTGRKSAKNSLIFTPLIRKRLDRQHRLYIKESWCTRLPNDINIILFYFGFLSSFVFPILKRSHNRTYLLRPRMLTRESKPNSSNLDSLWGPFACTWVGECPSFASEPMFSWVPTFILLPWFANRHNKDYKQE